MGLSWADYYQGENLDMEQWEYWTGFLWANATDDETRQYLKNRWPNWQPPKYAPQAMIPELNALGEKGWELVHMEPVRNVGKNHDILYSSGGETVQKDWSNVYFCVLKRKK
jgi:hypothetical protein